MCRGSVWGTICDDSWDSSDASVVCRQLQYSPNGELKNNFIFHYYKKKFFNIGSRAFSRAQFGGGLGPIHMDDVRCTGAETRLVDCRHTTNHNCVHSEDASVRCLAPFSKTITIIITTTM